MDRRAPLATVGIGAQMLSVHPFTTWDAYQSQPLEDRHRPGSPNPLFLPLSPQSHKGSSGRIGILGGSAQYTGAPYYAAMAALHAGADLAYVFTATEASLPIKCYSPELMVLPVYTASEFDAAAAQARRKQQLETGLCVPLSTDDPRNSAVATAKDEEATRLVDDLVNSVAPYLDRLHCLVIGPGLGRCPLVMEGVARLVLLAQSKGVPLVLDADALFLLSQDGYQDLLNRNSDGRPYPAVVTPNVVEYGRLAAAGVDLSSAVVVRKGAEDLISVGDNPSLNYCCTEEGGWKRSGGIGDVLAGTMATFLAWQAILNPASQEDWPVACWAACCAVRRATRAAFAEQRRAMTAPDVLRHLGGAIRGMEGDGKAEDK